jgi:magnesium transporter
MNGLILGILSATFVFLYLIITKNPVANAATEFTYANATKGALIVGVSLLTAMAVSSFVGAFTPVVFSKINIDPAVASGPLITTINDITALLIYYGMAMLLFIEFI